MKREPIRRRIYLIRDEARLERFEYIEMFYKPKRKNFTHAMLSPVIFEQQQKLNPQSV